MKKILMILIIFTLSTCVNEIEKGRLGAAGRLPIATRAAYLLVVGLDRPGGLYVHHRTNVRPVDAHPKGVGGHDDVEGSVRETPVDLLTDGRGEARVVRRNPPPVSA